MAKVEEYTRNTVGSDASPSYYISVAYIVSILLFNMTNYLIPHYLFLIWIISAFVFDNKKFLSIISRKYYIAFYVFLIYYFSSSLFAYPIGTCINRLFTTIELISPFIMYELYADYDVKKKYWLSLAFIVVFGMNFYQMMTTINYSAIAGLRQHEDDEGFINLGFRYIYSLTFVSCLLFYVLIKKMREHTFKSLYSLFMIIWLLLVVTIIFKSLFTTAIFMVLIGAVLAFYYGKKNWKWRIIVLGISSAIVFTLVVPFIGKQLSLIDEDYQLISTRLDEISVALSGGNIDEESSSGARFNRTIVSLKTFLTHPLFGVNHKTTDSSAYDGSTMIVGNHAEWVDSLAEYGLFALCLFYFLIQSSKRITKRCEVNVVFILYVIIGFLNPLLYCVQNSVCFYVVPMLYDVLMTSRKSKKSRIDKVLYYG